MAACGGGGDDKPPVPPPPAVVSVKVTPDAGAVEIGGTLQLSASALNASGIALLNRTVTWSVQEPTVGTVTSAGVITGLSAGNLTVVANSEGKSGTATIAVLPPVSVRCEASTPIAIGAVINGKISNTDCPLPDGSFADKWILTLADATPLRIAMRATDLDSLDSYLVLQNATTGAVIAENDDGNGGQGSRIEQLVPAGRYVVIASTFGPSDFGGYRLSISPASESCLVTPPLNIPNTVVGTLLPTACVLGDSSYADRYAIKVPATSRIRITMRSSQFDTFLFVEDTAGQLLDRRNFGGGGTNARIDTTFAPGNYIISATSAVPRDTGTYKLTVESTVDPCGVRGVVTPGTTLTDTLTIAACKLGDGSFARRYSLTVGALTPVRIDATSSQFDPYLIVQREGAAITVAEDDDSGPGQDAQLAEVLSTGTYIINVTSASVGEVGTFQLGVAAAAGPSVGITVSPATVALTPGQVQQLTATVTGTANTGVVWKTSGPSIVAVTPTGEVRGLSAGSATITAVAAADPSRIATAGVTVTDSGVANLDVPLVLLTQSTQSTDGRVPLVAGRVTTARVFVRASRSGFSTMPVRLRVYNGAVVTGTLTGTAFPQTIIDEACCAANITIPPGLVRDGMTVVADVDPDGVIAESNETDNAWPLVGVSKALRFVTVPTIDIQLVPIRHAGSGLVGPAAVGYTDLLQRMFPLSQVNAVVHAPYTTDLLTLTSVTSWTAMLRQMETLRTVENGTAYYFGILAQGAASGVIGIATLNGFAGVGISKPENIAQETLAHEFGHSFGRQHSPSPGCSAPANVDPSYPRADGTIGSTGFNQATGAIFPADRFDIMGYCDNTWISPYTYLGVLQYLRSGVIPASGPASRTGSSLLITGSFIDGGLTLDPVFTVAADPSAGRASGRFVAEGFASDGRLLFTHRFDGHAVGDADPSVRTFSERVAYDATARGAVARITVRDASARGAPAVLTRTGSYVPSAGGVSLRVDADPQLVARSSGAGRLEITWNQARYPSIIVRERASGRVLGIGQRGTLGVEGTNADAIDVMLSDGVSSVTRRLSSGGAP